jgi:hypothetical protein
MSYAGESDHPEGPSTNPWLRRWSSTLDTQTKNTMRRHSCSRSRRAGWRPSGSRTREVEVARAVSPSLTFEHGHRRGEVDTRCPPRCDQTASRQEGVVSTPEALAARLGGRHSRAHGERVHDALPGPDVVGVVARSGNFAIHRCPCDVEHARLGARPAERAPRRDEHTQPPAVATIALHPVALQLRGSPVRARGGRSTEVTPARRCRRGTDRPRRESAARPSDGRRRPRAGSRARSQPPRLARPSSRASCASRR